MEAHLIMDTVTSVDCAVITAEGAMVGHSFNPTLFVSGDVTANEWVVCDFGTLKKRAKAAIDDRDLGIDHKLWVPCSKNVHFEEGATEGSVVLVTPHVRVSAPADAFVLIRPSFVKVMPKGHTLIRNVYEFAYDESRSLEIMDTEGNINLFASAGVFGAVVSNLLSRRLPEFGFVIGLRDDPFDFRSPLFLQGQVMHPGKASLFRYTHGLPNSSSWGCQNIAHGHMSFIQCFGDSETPLLAASAWQIAMALNGTYFCNRQDLAPSEDDVEGAPPPVAYSTGRGDFSLKLKPTSKMVALNSDTTIENLTRHIVEVNAQYLRESGVLAVYISEGLNKGSIIWLKDIPMPEPVAANEANAGAVQA